MRLRPSFVTLLLATAAAAPARAHAQGLTGPAVLYAAPGANALATVAQGTALGPARTSGEYAQVTLRGFIATALLGGARDSFPASVSAADARLRAAASTSARVVASLEQGMGVHVVKRGRDWTEVSRTGWIRRSALPATVAKRSATPPAPAASAKSDPPRPVAAPQPAARPATADAASSDTTTPLGGILTPADSLASLAPAPGVAPIATLRRGAALMPLARDRGWVRVRLEGWVRERELTVADSSVAALSAADLRADPSAYVGKMVRWVVTVLAFQTADPLRRDMRPDEPYLLARGPDRENAILYLALPEGLVDRARTLAPMTTVVVTARVRTGKSDPAGVPILDVLTLTRQ